MHIVKREDAVRLAGEMLVTAAEIIQPKFDKAITPNGDFVQLSSKAVKQKQTDDSLLITSVTAIYVMDAIQYGVTSNITHAGIKPVVYYVESY